MGQTKPQDLLLCLKLAVTPAAFETYATLGAELGLGESEAYRSARRAAAARLLDLDGRVPVRANLVEFVLHGAPYAFPAERGGPTRGLLTGVGATPIRNQLTTPGPTELPVWPDAEGDTRGYALTPLHPSVPFAARHDARLYEVLALLDALREGRARERVLAADLLSERLRQPPDAPPPQVVLRWSAPRPRAVVRDVSRLDVPFTLLRKQPGTLRGAESAHVVTVELSTHLRITWGLAERSEVLTRVLFAYARRAVVQLLAEGRLGASHTVALSIQHAPRPLPFDPDTLPAPESHVERLDVETLRDDAEQIARDNVAVGLRLEPDAT